MRLAQHTIGELVIGLGLSAAAGATVAFLLSPHPPGPEPSTVARIPAAKPTADASEVLLEPTATPIAVETASTPLATETATALAASTASSQQPTPAAEHLRTVLDEQWTDPHRWPDNPQSTAWYAPAGYQVFARTPTQFIAIGAPLDEPLLDVVVSGMFHKVGGQPGGGYGIIIRDQGPGPRDGLNQIGNYYVFEVGDTGQFGIWRREGDQWADMISWTNTSAIHADTAINELVVRASGPALTFLINGSRVAEQTDVAPAPGSVGIFVGGDFNEVLVQRFSVQTLD